MATIKIYTKTSCKSCRELKGWFKHFGVNYDEIILDDDKERRGFYESMGNGVKTVPQLFIDDERIGGVEDFLNREDELREKLGVKMAWA